jgi:spore coat polysaccharide biosynthesis predicted glycosyltransferase SpsG
LVSGEFNNYPYIEKSDFVVGSGGQGLLERLAVGRPSLAVIASDNQKDQAAYMEKLIATEVLEK